MFKTSSSTPRFLLGPGYWAMVSPGEKQATLKHYRRRIADTFKRNGIIHRCESSRIDIIIMAGLEACQLFFIAALHEPTKIELLEFFDDFACRAMGATNSHVN